MTAVPPLLSLHGPRASRRQFLRRLAGALGLPLLCVPPVVALPARLLPLIREVTAGQPLHPGRVHVQLPVLAESGHSVPLTVRVDSAMSVADGVQSLHLFSEKNPRPLLARFHFGPQAGRAEVSTRIRLAGTQRIVAVAVLRDGSCWSGVAQVVVTVASCADGE